MQRARAGWLAVPTAALVLAMGEAPPPAAPPAPAAKVPEARKPDGKAGAKPPAGAALEMTIRTIEVRGDSPVVILQREPDHKRTLEIFVGGPEALAIAQEWRKLRSPRPMTHDLLRNVIRSLGGKVTKVVVNDVRDGTFYAQIVIERDGEEILVDARPSDSIALALRHDAKIFVEPAVLEDSGKDAEPEETEKPAAKPKPAAAPADEPRKDEIPADAI